MFHLNATTVLLVHEDRVNHLQKMHEPLSMLSRWSWPFWRKSNPSEIQSRAQTQLEKKT
jgi:hypothetical protein